MTHVIYLLRHGIAEDRSGDGNDACRELTADGVRKTRRVALGMRALGVAPDAILSSPLVRAEQTARIAAEVLHPGLDVQTTAALGPEYTPESVLRVLQGQRRCQSVLLVGHQPGLGELASYLLTGSSGLVALAFKKAGLAAISLPALPPTTTGVLEWFLTPRQLRAIAAGVD